MLPVYDAMDKSVKDQFPVILTKSMIFIVSLMCVFASVVYLAFGSATQVIVTLNLPNDTVNTGKIAVQLAYSLALIFSYPLLMYPAMMVLENLVVVKSKNAPMSKNAFMWKKNIFRFLLVSSTAIISIFCMDELDNFVALIGGLFAVPMAFVFPCAFHNRLVGTNKKMNSIVIAIGLGTMVFATYQAIDSWKDNDPMPLYCVNS